MLAFANCGTTIAARTPRITTTIRISTSVKPLRLVVRVAIGLLLGGARRATRSAGVNPRTPRRLFRDPPFLRRITTAPSPNDLRYPPTRAKSGRAGNAPMLAPTHDRTPIDLLAGARQVPLNVR